MESPTTSKGQSQVSYSCGEGWGQLFCCSCQQHTGTVLPVPANHKLWISTHMVSSYGICGNTGHEDQHRSQLQQDHRPRHGPHSSVGTDITIARLQSTLPRSVWCQCQHGPWTPTWYHVADQTSSFCTALCGNMSHGYQFRCWCRA